MFRYVRFFVAETQLVPLAMTVVSLFVLTQLVKWTTHRAGVRDSRLVNVALPLVPVVFGALAGAVYGDYIGLQLVVATETIPWTLGALHGAVLGAVSGQAYKLVLEWLPEQYAAILRQEIPAEEGGRE